MISKAAPARAKARAGDFFFAQGPAVGLLDFIKRVLGTADTLPPPEQGHGVDELARRLQVSVDELRSFEPAYHAFTLPKRRGGTRTIHAPASALKTLQRRVLRRLLARLPVHPAATGFQSGQSIATHALVHAMRPVVVRMDIRDFFPSTKAKCLNAYFRRIGWNQAATDVLLKCCTHAGGLPQGAPTSPRLSNLVNFRMDTRLSGLAAHGCTLYQNPQTGQAVAGHGQANILYTRYADDITISFDADVHGVVNSMIHAAKRIVEDEGYALHTKKKLRVMRPHDRQIVTGLVVNAGVNLPRRTRRWLRAVEHHAATGRTCTLTDAQLAGWRALRGMIRTQAGAG